MKLSDLHNGESGVIVRVTGHGAFRRRIIEMGFVRGQHVMSVLNSPLNDPVKYSVMGYEVSLRRSEAAMIEILTEEEAEKAAMEETNNTRPNAVAGNDIVIVHNGSPSVTQRKNVIRIALVGNPNSGKTSLFNILSGGREHVGNYGGVTVAAKNGHFTYNGYKFSITDLPGTYSLSPYSPEERYVRQHIFDHQPDVIINVVSASNLERNLYLTTELIDLSQPTVVALNMYDELATSGATLDYHHLGAMIGIPMTPTVAKNGKGLNELLNKVIDIFENRSAIQRHIQINYGTAIELEVDKLSQKMQAADELPYQFPPRYWALKMLEDDSEAERMLSHCGNYATWKDAAHQAKARLKRQLNDDIETTVIDFKYGFIAGALQEVYIPGNQDIQRKTGFIDRLVANRWLGFPIFIFLMWLTFMTTFWLGAFPQEWIETGFARLGEWIASSMADGALKDLLVNGIIGGVGSVAVFLPNILVLYLFISLMEDSGYMARAAFIMDRIMHRMGLHGKSFIPLLMGFGCNVPAIMATRTIESHSSRLITILINPFMSCSARLPVYLLLAGTFFPNSAGTVLVLLYFFGIGVAVVTARLLRWGVFKADETPFVMELPPYRMPTLRATLRHMWDKGEQYLRKIGGVVLVASVIIWFLSYYPRPSADVSADVAETEVAASQHYENSYLGQLGKFCEPVVHPFGLNWKAAIALISGSPAKEVIVSTLGVLYRNEDETTLSNTLRTSGDFTPRSALAFLVFVLLYFPCIASIAAIAKETGSRKWAAFSIIYNTGIAWIAAFTVYHLAGIFF